MEITTEKLTRKLFIKPYDRMINDIVNEITSGQIVIDPDYQRKYVWSNTKASLLIESILLNIPIPVIYASEDTTGKWIIVDGLQRLYSLKRFFDNSFRLTGLEALKELNGMKFNALNEIIQKKLERGELRIIVLQSDSDPNIQFDIFMRLNTGAVKLNEQELRNCLYRGSLNSMIKTIASNNEFVKKLFPHNIDRMLSSELILRYLAVTNSFNKVTRRIENYDGRIKNLLNTYMSINQSADDTFLCNIKIRFEEQIEKAFQIFGTTAFKKNGLTTKVNASLYECIMIAFEDYSISTLIQYKDSILSMHNELMNDDDFVKTIDKATGNTEVMNKRLSTYIARLREIMNNEG